MSERNFWSVLYLIFRSALFGVATLTLGLMIAVPLWNIQKDPKFAGMSIAFFLCGFGLSWYERHQHWKRGDAVQDQLKIFPVKPPVLKDPPVQQTTEAVGLFQHEIGELKLRAALASSGYLLSYEECLAIEFESCVAAWSFLLHKQSSEVDPTDILELAIMNLPESRRDEFQMGSERLLQQNQEDSFVGLWTQLGIPYRPPYRDGLIMMKIQILVRVFENRLSLQQHGKLDGVVSAIAQRALSRSSDNAQLALAVVLLQDIEKSVERLEASSN